MTLDCRRCIIYMMLKSNRSNFVASGHQIACSHLILFSAGAHIRDEIPNSEKKVIKSTPHTHE